MFTAPAFTAAPATRSTFTAAVARAFDALTVEELKPTATVDDIATAHTAPHRAPGTTVTGWTRMSHADCDHDSTAKARAACRKAHGHA